MDEWVKGMEDLKNLAVNFYVEFFTSDSTSGGEFIIGQFPQFIKEVRNGLEEEYSFAKTRKDLMGMGSFKAIRPGRYHPIFFKRTWELTSLALHTFAKGVISGQAIPLTKRKL